MLRWKYHLEIVIYVPYNSALTITKDMYQKIGHIKEKAQM